VWVVVRANREHGRKVARTETQRKEREGGTGGKCPEMGPSREGAKTEERRKRTRRGGRKHREERRGVRVCVFGVVGPEKNGLMGLDRVFLQSFRVQISRFQDEVRETFSSLFMLSGWSSFYLTLRMMRTGFLFRISTARLTPHLGDIQIIGADSDVKEPPIKFFIFGIRR
jgi:hypothetical protein